MKLDFKCLKCGCTKYTVKSTILPEKNPGLKLELGTYYLKTCLNCGYTEIYSAKIVAESDKKANKENDINDQKLCKQM